MGRTIEQSFLNISGKSEGKTLNPQPESKIFAVNCRIALVGDNCYWIHLTSTEVYQFQHESKNPSCVLLNWRFGDFEIMFLFLKTQLFLLSILYKRNECYSWSVLCDHVLIFRLLRSNGTTAILSRTAKRSKKAAFKTSTERELKEMYAYLIVINVLFFLPLTSVDSCRCDCYC